MCGTTKGSIGGTKNVLNFTNIGRISGCVGCYIQTNWTIRRTIATREGKATNQTKEGMG